MIQLSKTPSTSEPAHPAPTRVTPLSVLYDLCLLALSAKLLLAPSVWSTNLLLFYTWLCVPLGVLLLIAINMAPQVARRDERPGWWRSLRWASAFFALFALVASGHFLTACAGILGMVLSSLFRATNDDLVKKREEANITSSGEV